jgi:hypothetical protein
MRPGDAPDEQWSDGDIFLAADGVEWKLCRIREMGAEAKFDRALWCWSRFGRNGYAAFPYPARPMMRVRLVVEGQEENFVRGWLLKNSVTVTRQGVTIMDDPKPRDHSVDQDQEGDPI